MTIQEKLEYALSEIAQEHIRVSCAGRTDAGVHAYNQYANFKTNAIRELGAWFYGVNSFLPVDIRIKWVKILDDLNFDARYNAVSRAYRYIILNTPQRSAIYYNHTAWVRNPLDEQVMHTSAQTLVGTHDFTSFRGPDCQSLTPVRTIHSIEVTRKENEIYIDIIANAFLHNMVRNIAGTLIDIGRGKRNQEWLIEILRARKRTNAVMTAPASGLYLYNVTYCAF